MKESYEQTNTFFADTLRKLRTERGLSQAQLSEQLYVNRSTVARWENGTRLPDALMIARLSRILDVDLNTMLSLTVKADRSPCVIMVDDRKIVLNGGLPILREVLPDATITGFTRPSQAIEYAKTHVVSLAFLDIELGKTRGFDLCRTLLDINPYTNVVFLTAYVDYSFDAWDTGASGFMMKPITPEGVQKQLKTLRYPL